jgi:hypothetical protein
MGGARVKAVAQTFLSAVSPAFLPADVGWPRSVLSSAGWNACATGGINVQNDRNFLSLTVLN